MNKHANKQMNKHTLSNTPTKSPATNGSSSYAYLVRLPDRLSLMLEFDLICESAIIANLSSTLFFIVGMTAPVGLLLADRYGRKPVIYVSIAAGCIAYSAAYFTTSAAGYLVFRAVCGLLQVRVSVE